MATTMNKILRFVPRAFAALPRNGCVPSNWVGRAQLSTVRASPSLASAKPSLHRRYARHMSVFKSPFADVDIPEDKSVIEFLRSKWPSVADKTAIVNGVTGDKMTFQELGDRVDGAAAALQKNGFGEGDVMAIHMTNCPEFCIAFFACAQVGGVVTTSNPMYTSRELHNQLNDSDAKILVTSRNFRSQADEAVPDTNVREVVFIEDESTFLQEKPDPSATFPKLPLPKDRTLALPYSGGTTGLPKGVQLSHYNIIANVCQFSDCKDITDWRENDVVLALLPFFHIYGMVVIMISTLYQGIPMVTLPSFEPGQFLKVLQDEKISIAYLVPPIILFMAKHPIVDKFSFDSLRDVFSGAAPLDAETQQAAAKRLNAMVRQGYGMTEMSPVSHSNRCSDGGKVGSSGQLVPRGECKIINEAGETLPPNEEGELVYRGPNVMMGYFNRPDATAEMLGDDGWLRTGDIARIDEDGFLFIVDRAKELIKVKGLQVAPAELEGLLLACPEIADAAVIGIDDERSGQVPKAFVVLSESGKGLSEQAVMDLVNDKVATYKRIRKVDFIDEVPKSPSGKILRRFLK